MGQKVHPVGMRLGIFNNWSSCWYADRKDYAKFLHEDMAIRKFIKKELLRAAVARIDIERAANNLKLNIYSARPGIIIGKKGAEVDKLKKSLEKMIKRDISINIQEIRKAEIEAQLIAENVAVQLERRIAFRRAMRRAVSTAMKFGALGVRVACAGRLGGAEMARREWYREGRVPLHTLRANIDYGFALARTTYGVIGVKVWVYKGDILLTEKALN